MKILQKKKGITLIALVITIVIMLLLAAVVIQIAIGENGLFEKAQNSKKEQAKAELFETAKLEYLNLKTKAIVEKKAEPQEEDIFNESNFMNKYNIVDDNITDKQGNIIDTKENVIKSIKNIKDSGSTPTPTPVPTPTPTPTPTPATSSPSGAKTIGGVTIPESDKDKLIIKLKVKNNMRINFGGLRGFNGSQDPRVNTEGVVNVDYGNGTNGVITDFNDGVFVDYTVGEYVVKFENITNFHIGKDTHTYGPGYTDDYDMEILQWGKDTQGWLELYNVSKIYEPENGKSVIEYYNGKFNEIPEWLFKNKGNSTKISRFYYCNNITTVPGNLFNNCNNVDSLQWEFYDCRNITSIPDSVIEYMRLVRQRGGNVYPFSGFNKANEYNNAINQ